MGALHVNTDGLAGNSQTAWQVIQQDSWTQTAWQVIQQDSDTADSGN